jgi:hypothetical protein
MKRRLISEGDFEADPMQERLRKTTCGQTGGLKVIGRRVRRTTSQTPRTWLYAEVDANEPLSRLKADCSNEKLQVRSDRKLVSHPLTKRVAASRAQAPHGAFAGERVGIAVIDSEGFKDHEALDGRLKVFSVTGGTVQPLANKAQWIPAGGHGMAVATVAAGAGQCASPAPKANVWAYQAEWLSDLIAALEHILDQAEIKVVCMAQNVAPPDAELPEEFPELDEVLDALARSGRTFCTAAGNRGLLQNEPQMLEPALSPHAVTVGGWTETGQRFGPTSDDDVADESSRGPTTTTKPEFLCRWSGYIAAGGDPAARNDYDFGASGTSVAVAHAAGLIATWYGVDPTLNADRVRQLLRAHRVCVKLVNDATLQPYAPNEQGEGALDPVAALHAVLSRVP